MKITATGDTGLTVSGEGDGLELTTDGPPISPYHFLAASLASCVYVVFQGWAEQAGVGLSGLTLDVGWEHDEENRVESMELTVDWPGLEEKRRSTVRRLAAACPVHETLHRGTEIAVSVGGP